MDSLFQLAFRSQTILGGLHLVFFLVSWSTVIDVLRKYKDKDGFHFNCVPKPSDFTRQRCLNNYTSAMSPLLTPLDVAAIVCGALSFIWVIFILVGAVIIRWIRRERNEQRKRRLSIRFLWSFVCHVFAQLAVLGGMMGLFCAYQSFRFPAEYKCSQTNTTPTTFNKMAVNITCNDLRYKEKTKLNIAIIVIMAISIALCLLTVIHLAVTRKAFLDQLLGDIFEKEDDNAAGINLVDDGENERSVDASDSQTEHCRTTADQASPGNQEPPVGLDAASNGQEPPDHEHGEMSTDGRTTAIPTQEKQEETSNNYEDFLVSVTELRGNKFLQDKLRFGLDHRSNPLVKHWEHLAEELDVPHEIRLKCKLNSGHSCTTMLLDVLAAEKKLKTVNDLISRLKEIQRIDLATDEDLRKHAEEQFSDFFTSLGNSELITKIADKLDQKSRVNKYWRDLGSKYLSSETLQEIEYGPFNPTQLVMEHLYSKKPDLTIGTFYDVVEKKLNQRIVLEKLKPILEEVGRDELMEKVVKLDSEAMRSICVRLNTKNRALNNWKNLANAFGIPRDIYQSLDEAKPMSPTESLFEWIFVHKGDLTVGQLCNALGKIERNDLAGLLSNHFLQNKTGQM